MINPINNFKNMIYDNEILYYIPVYNIIITSYGRAMTPSIYSCTGFSFINTYIDSNNDICIEINNTSYSLSKLLLIYIMNINIDMNLINVIYLDNNIYNLNLNNLNYTRKEINVLSNNDIIDIYNKSKYNINDRKYAKEYNITTDIVKSIRLLEPPYDNIIGTNKKIYPRNGYHKISEKDAVDIYKLCKNKKSYNYIKKIYKNAESPSIAKIRSCSKNYSFLKDKYGFEPIKREFAKFDDKIALEICNNFYINKKSKSELSREYNIGRQTISKIINAIFPYDYLKDEIDKIKG